jgi:hypothetical protein
LSQQVPTSTEEAPFAMPYPDSCPECGGAFRNTGTHYTARRNEVGRHVLLELGCQNTSRRYWWDFTSGTAAEDGATPGHPVAAASAMASSALDREINGHTGLATLDLPAGPVFNGYQHMHEPAKPTPTTEQTVETEPSNSPRTSVEKTTEPPPTLKEAFVRDL